MVMDNARNKNNGYSVAKCWNCEFCHATNVHQGVCGCGESRKRNGRELKTETNPDMVELVW